MDNRAVSPVVGKLLAAGLAVLYIASITGLLVGGIVPDYRAATGEELGERVLATAASHVEQVRPATDGNVTARTGTSLPATIRDQQYSLRLVNGTLVLDHPDDSLDARTRLALPPNVTATTSTWHSGDRLVVRVTGPATNRTLTLRESER
jgi:FlaG/FlaF family flagellin (archaellin)